jgi:hypothetical protein
MMKIREATGQKVCRAKVNIMTLQHCNDILFAGETLHVAFLNSVWVSPS